MVKNPPAMQETWVWSLGQEDPLEKGMATHSHILAWRIPWTERSLVGYSPYGHQELDTTEARRRRWHPTPVLLPGKFHEQRSLVDCSPWGHEESDTTEQLHLTFHFHALEKEMGTHSSVLAWRIPGTAEPGGLLSMGSHRVGHDWSDLAAAAEAP